MPPLLLGGGSRWEARRVMWGRKSDVVKAERERKSVGDRKQKSDEVGRQRKKSDGWGRKRK